MPHRLRCLFALLLIVGFSSAVQAQAQPSVTSTNPVNGATNVMRDVFVCADVFVPNGGIDPATLTSSTVFLYRTSDAQRVAAVLNTSGGGDDVIALRTWRLHLASFAVKVAVLNAKNAKGDRKERKEGVVLLS